MQYMHLIDHAPWLGWFCFWLTCLWGDEERQRAQRDGVRELGVLGEPPWGNKIYIEICPLKRGPNVECDFIAPVKRVVNKINL